MKKCFKDRSKLVLVSFWRKSWKKNSRFFNRLFTLYTCCIFIIHIISIICYYLCHSFNEDMLIQNADLLLDNAIMSNIDHFDCN